MTIHVVTPEHGTQSFSDADGWETLAGELGDEGNLSITKSEDDEYYEHTIAEFAKGAWLFVYETEVLETEPEEEPESIETRKWDDLFYVSTGTKVQDHYGFEWRWSSGFWRSNRDGFGQTVKPIGQGHFTHLGPFTEVLDV